MPTVDPETGVKDGKEPLNTLKRYNTASQGGGLSVFTDRDQRSIFTGFEFRKSVFLGGTGNSCCILFGSLNECCTLKGFEFSTVFLCQFYSPGTSVNTALHS